MARIISLSEEIAKIIDKEKKKLEKRTQEHVTYSRVMKSILQKADLLESDTKKVRS
jgi:hypothetical protein